MAIATPLNAAYLLLNVTLDGFPKTIYFNVIDLAVVASFQAAAMMSLLLYTLIGIDRLVSVSHPLHHMKYFSKPNLKIAVFIIWAFSALFGSLCIGGHIILNMVHGNGTYRNLCNRDLSVYGNRMFMDYHVQ